MQYAPYAFLSIGMSNIMIRVLFDHQIFSLQQYGGISRYFCELATHLMINGGAKPKVSAFFHLNKHLRETRNITKHSNYVPYVKKTTLARFFLNTLLFEAYCQLSNPDIIHHTYYGKQLYKKAKQFTTIHDLIPEKYPYYFDNVNLFLRLKREAVMRSDCIICVSNSTKTDLIEYYGVPESKVSVIYLASSLASFASSLDHNDKLASYGINKPYILYVGARHGYKNFMSLLNSISNSKRILNNYSLICFGGPAFSNQEKATIARLGLQNRVSYLSGSDSLLSQLYQNADLFVYPSLYEGFGLPLIEAMSLGCPVACSDITIFKEISNGGSKLFNPEDESSIKDVLEEILFSPKLREHLIQNGYENSSRFSWSKTAENTVAIYKKILSER
jgi:glycosyltransferase involved in cell wall biosynthesis